MPGSDDESGGDEEEGQEERVHRDEEIYFSSPSDATRQGVEAVAAQTGVDNGGSRVASPQVSPKPCKLCSNAPECKVVLEYSWPATNNHVGSEGSYMSFPLEKTNCLMSRLYFMKESDLVGLNGPTFTHKAPTVGQWLLPLNDCRSALTRLRKAALAAYQQPDLNRIVLEQKNDDGLLELVSKWVTDSNVITHSLETFGCFAADALLAPVLHTILRSQWLAERKARLELNNVMPYGWGSEFYDCVGINKPCCTQCESCVAASQVYLVMHSMGRSPWSTLQALRAIPTNIPLCLGTAKWAAGLMEHASIEASISSDWLVRNETVIEFCALMYEIHRPRENLQCDNIDIFAQCITSHRMAYECQAPLLQNLDADALAAMFSVSHLDADSLNETKQEVVKQQRQTISPADVLRLVHLLDKRAETLKYTSIKDTFLRGASPCVLKEAQAPFSESAPADPLTISECLTNCYPIVATQQLNLLDPNTGGSAQFSGHLWPIFVNRTRRCYSLFRALALPTQPASAYLLEILVQGWRLSARVLHRLPASSGPSLCVGKEHFERYFAAPLCRLQNWGVITPEEESGMIETLQRGIVPCFAGPGDSAPDRVVSATTALAFAACGLRIVDTINCEIGHTVTTAGLFYFAAWYILVYGGISQLSRSIQDDMVRNGSDADRLLLETIQLREDNGSVRVASYKRSTMLNALKIVFGRFIAPHTIACFAELYGAGLQLQLPYAKMLRRTPGSVKAALDSRDTWLAMNRGSMDAHKPVLVDQGTHFPPQATTQAVASKASDPPFIYLGPIDCCKLSTLAGLGKSSPVARAVDAWDDEAYNLWYGTVSWVGEDVQAVLSESLENIVPNLESLHI